jgi:restriction system protein
VEVGGEADFFPRGNKREDGTMPPDNLVERVYVQAKRRQASVGRPEVQAFHGALAGRRARKGVFITTSTFTREAQEFATHVIDSIVLMDGFRLTSLMIEHGAGVSPYRLLRLPKVDADYFDMTSKSFRNFFVASHEICPT